MASERAKQMQQANTLAEVLASLDRIEIALGIKPKPEEGDRGQGSGAGKKAVSPPTPDPQSPTPPGQGSAAMQPRSGMASRQNPVGGKR